MALMKSKTEFGENQNKIANQPELIRSLLEGLLNEVISTEFERFIQASPYERSESRSDQRNGSYQRGFRTRYGSLALEVPRSRNGGFQSQVFEKWQRTEQAFQQVLCEMVVQGVSTRKVQEIVASLTDTEISHETVSAWAKQLDEPLQKWRERDLTQPYPYLMLDARYEKIRENRRVISCGFVTVIGVSSSGYREILATEVIVSENQTEYTALFRSLKQRGLTGVRYVVSDDHEGLKKAVQAEFTDASWQRCQVHYLRNFMNKMPKTALPEWKLKLQAVFAADSMATALRLSGELTNQLQEKHKSVADWLEASIEDALQIMTLPESHWKRMKSTNMVERFNQELKRRSRVVRIFPNRDSVQRLLGTICMVTSEAWTTGSIYLNLNTD